eukprot:1194807-Prorocentrum_minimum.AAC.5
MEETAMGTSLFDFKVRLPNRMESGGYVDRQYIEMLQNNRGPQQHQGHRPSTRLDAEALIRCSTGAKVKLGKLEMIAIRKAEQLEHEVAQLEQEQEVCFVRPLKHTRGVGIQYIVAHLVVDAQRAHSQLEESQAELVRSFSGLEDQVSSLGHIAVRKGDQLTVRSLKYALSSAPSLKPTEEK